MKRWWPLVALASAQFVMVLDQSVMNVSISTLVLLRNRSAHSRSQI